MRLGKCNFENFLRKNYEKDIIAISEIRLENNSSGAGKFDETF